MRENERKRESFSSPTIFYNIVKKKLPSIDITYSMHLFVEIVTIMILKSLWTTGAYL